MNEIATTDRVKIDERRAGELAIGGGVAGVKFADMLQVMDFSKMMSISGVAVPKHVRGQPGVALGILMQAIDWEMQPYAVANKSYYVSDRLAYEAQLIHAVILRRAPIRGRPKITYDGDGADRRCTVRFELRDEPGEFVEYTSPRIGDIKVQNSPLWKSDPDQQLFYYSARAAARRHFPDVILGVYAVEEVEDDEPRRVVSERADAPAPKGLAAKLDALGGAQQNSPAVDTPVSSAGDEAAEDSDPSAADPAESAYGGADTVEGGETTIRARLERKDADGGQDKPEAGEGSPGADVASDGYTAEDIKTPGEAFTFFRNRQWPAELAECKTRIAVTARLEHYDATMKLFEPEQVEELKAMAAERIADIQALKKPSAES